MGTTGEWLQVLLMGGFVGGVMAWGPAHRRASANRNPAWRIGDVIDWALMGLAFGIVVTFHWRAFHRPLVFVTVAVFAVAFLVGWIRRKKRPLNF